MVQLAPSKNPEKESKTFGTLGLACGILSLFIWVVAVAGLGFAVRGIILSKRVGNHKYLAFSIIGLVLSLFSIVWYLLQSK